MPLIKFAKSGHRFIQVLLMVLLGKLPRDEFRTGILLIDQICVLVIVVLDNVLDLQVQIRHVFELTAI